MSGEGSSVIFLGMLLASAFFAASTPCTLRSWMVSLQPGRNAWNTGDALPHRYKHHMMESADRMRILSFVSDLTVPVAICLILLHGIYKGVPVFDTFIEGAREGIGVSFKILPALVGLLTAIGMFSASGALDVLTSALSPLTRMLQLPPEVMPLAILRPISGSGSMAIFQKLLEDLGPDSMGGRIASVMMGSAETTFYTIAIYFGATSVKDTRHTVIAGLTADVVGFVASAVLVRLMFY